MNQILIAAINEAIRSNDTCLVGAVVHRKSTILSVGHNDCEKTHPESQIQKFNTGHHAELSALTGIKHYDLKNLEITVVRILRKDGSFAIAKPCENCMRIIEEYGVKKIHYSTGKGTIATIERKSERRISEKVVKMAHVAVGSK